MTHIATTFPNGILMIGRIMLLLSIGIIFRYYDLKHHSFQIPNEPLFHTAFDVLNAACGLLLLSKKTIYIRISLLVIAVKILFQLLRVATGYQFIGTTPNILLMTISVAIHIFLFIYIRTKLNQYLEDKPTQYV